MVQNSCSPQQRTRRVSPSSVKAGWNFLDFRRSAVAWSIEFIVMIYVLLSFGGTMRPTIQHLARGGVTKTVPPDYKMQGKTEPRMTRMSRISKVLDQERRERRQVTKTGG